LDKSVASDEDESVSYLPQQMTKDGFAIPAPKPAKVVAPMLPQKEDLDEEEDNINPWEKS